MSQFNVPRAIFIDRLNDDLRLSNIVRRELSKASSGKIGAAMNLVPTDEDERLLRECSMDVFNHAYVTVHVSGLSIDDMRVMSGDPGEVWTSKYITKHLSYWCVTYLICLDDSSDDLEVIAKELDQMLDSLYPISWKRLKSEYGK